MNTASLILLVIAIALALAMVILLSRPANRKSNKEERGANFPQILVGGGRLSPEERARIVAEQLRDWPPD